MVNKLYKFKRKLPIKTLPKCFSNIFNLAEKNKTSCLFQVYKNPYGEFWIEGLHLPRRDGDKVQSVLKNYGKRRRKYMIKTVSVNGYEFRVDFTYQPHERASRHYPGATECVEIDEVWSPDGLKLEEWAFELIQDDLEMGCLEAVEADQIEARLSKEESKQEAWEERQRLQFEQWE